MTIPTRLAWLEQPIKAIDQAAQQAAEKRQTQLTKPLGALGDMEALAVRLAGMRGQIKPQLNDVQVSVFAADHGIAAVGVSAYPQEVTAQMVMNFAFGGAAVSVVARYLGASFEVVNLGTVAPVPPHEQVISRVIAPGTQDFSSVPAMDNAQLAQALMVGCERLDACAQRQPDLFIAGEMGIGNTSSASALAAVLLKRSAAELVGPGTGLDSAQVVRKAALIQQAMELHLMQEPNLEERPLALLQRMGGFEIAAMTGAYIRAGQLGIPVLVDGFISTAAALVALQLKPELADWLIYGHCSAEPGHRLLLEHLQAKPLLQLSMRLGEGSGAALAVDLMRSACHLHAEMATFDEAGVSDKT